MKETKKFRTRRVIAVCAAAVLVLALATAAYAADVGGIHRTIQLWVHGDQTSAVLDIQNGEYTLTYTDEDGTSRERGGGGVAYDFFGRERPLTEAEILEHLNSPEVEYRADGTVWVYYMDQALEITDKFDDDGVCYVQLKSPNGTLYLTVKHDNGFSYSERAYPNPKLFN